MKCFARHRVIAVAASVTLIALSLSALAHGADRGTAAPAGVVSHLNLVSDKSQDLATLDAWKRTYLKPGMSDQEKAIAVFNTMTRYRQQASPPHGLNSIRRLAERDTRGSEALCDGTHSKIGFKPPSRPSACLRVRGHGLRSGLLNRLG